MAVEKYEEQCTFCTVKTEECGTFVSLENPFLCASPDRLVNTDIILEVKCPFAARNKVINAVNVPYLKICPETHALCLNKNHNYYFQIQGQLYCSGRNVCHFWVYTFEDTKLIIVPRDDEFIQTMVNTLRTFFTEYFRDAVVTKIV